MCMINKIKSENLLSLGTINSSSRLLVKKSGIFIEFDKPNIFLRIWRKLTGQYNRCKIAQKAVELFTTRDQLSRVPDRNTRNLYLDNLEAIVDQISVKQRKCKVIHDDLYNVIQRLRLPSSEAPQNSNQTAIVIQSQSSSSSLPHEASEMVVSSEDHQEPAPELVNSNEVSNSSIEDIREPEGSIERRVLLRLLRKDGQILQFVNEPHRSDREVVLTAVQQTGHALSYASLEFCDDPRVVMTAVRSVGCSLRFASDRLRDDPEFVKAVVQLQPNALEYASERLQDDLGVVLIALRQRNERVRVFTPFKYASARLKDDPEVVIAAVRQSPRAIEFASPNLRMNERENIIAAAAQPEPIGTVEDSVVSPQFDIGTNFLDEPIEELSEVSEEELSIERRIILQAVMQNGNFLRCASQSLRADPELVMAAVRKDGYALQFASRELREDRNIVLAAVRQNKRVLSLISRHFLNDPEIWNAANDMDDFDY